MRFWLSRMSQRDAEGRAARPVKAFAVLALAGGLAGCASNVGDRIGDNLPASMGGLPAGAPARPAEAPAYPAVHDMPPPRANTVLSEDEVKQAERDLVRMRSQQQPEPAAAPAKTATKTANKTAKKKPPQPQQ
jgi:hypothetical protein